MPGGRRRGGEGSPLTPFPAAHATCPGPGRMPLYHVFGVENETNVTPSPGRPTPQMCLEFLLSAPPCCHRFCSGPPVPSSARWASVVALTLESEVPREPVPAPDRWRWLSCPVPVSGRVGSAWLTWPLSPSVELLWVPVTGLHQRSRVAELTRGEAAGRGGEVVIALDSGQSGTGRGRPLGGDIPGGSDRAEEPAELGLREQRGQTPGPWPHGPVTFQEPQEGLCVTDGANAQPSPCASGSQLPLTACPGPLGRPLAHDGLAQALGVRGRAASCSGVAPGSSLEVVTSRCSVCQVDRWS